MNWFARIWQAVEDLRCCFKAWKEGYSIQLLNVSDNIDCPAEEDCIVFLEVPDAPTARIVGFSFVTPDGSTWSVRKATSSDSLWPSVQVLGSQDSSAAYQPVHFTLPHPTWFPNDGTLRLVCGPNPPTNVTVFYYLP